MPYSERIKGKIDALTEGWKDLEQKKMFGGICYLTGGNMCFGIYRDYLIVRLGEERARRAMGKASVKPFDITGRPMKGWVMVAEGGWRRDDDLRKWLEEGRGFAAALPPK